MQQRYDGPEFQRPAGFEPQDSWRMYHLLTVAAAESSAGGRGGGSGAASSDAAELAKKLQEAVGFCRIFHLSRFGVCSPPVTRITQRGRATMK